MIPNLHAVQTLTSPKAASALNTHLPPARPRLNVLLQVNTSGETSKSGLPPAPSPELAELARHVVARCPRLRLQGLMTIGALERSLHADEGGNEDFERLVGAREYLQGVLSAEFGEADGRWGEEEEGGRLVLSMGMSGDFEEALANFNDTLLYLRGNNNIDYEQLGLKFKLFSCEVLFNRGLCYIYLQQMDQGMQDLVYAAKEKVVPDHDVIDEAIREQAQGYTVFSIPVGIVYRPNEAKVKNLKAKDYLGKARLVAASDRSNAFTGFSGSEIKNVSAVIIYPSTCIHLLTLAPGRQGGSQR